MKDDLTSEESLGTVEALITRAKELESLAADCGKTARDLTEEIARLNVRSEALLLSAREYRGLSKILADKKS